MPTYEYECPDCGPFTDVRPMAEYDQPQACPDCINFRKEHWLAKHSMRADAKPSRLNSRLPTNPR